MNVSIWAAGRRNFECVFASKAKNLVSVGQAKLARAVGSMLKENVADEARNLCG